MARAGRYYGDRALYTCDTGHQIVGAEERVCQDTGQWSDSEPYCKKRGQYILESIAGTSFDAAETGPQAHNFMNHSP